MRWHIEVLAVQDCNCYQNDLVMVIHDVGKMALLVGSSVTGTNEWEWSGRVIAFRYRRRYAAPFIAARHWFCIKSTSSAV